MHIPRAKLSLLYACIACVCAADDEQSGCVRVRWYDKVYDAGIEPGNFLSSYNEVAGLPASAGGPVFMPSQATAVSSSQIQYGPRPRRKGTYIFEGMIALSARMAGRYLFKLTTDSSAHMLIDGKVVIDNGGFHPKQTKTGIISLKAGEQYHMQVRTRTSAWHASSTGASVPP